MPKTLIQPYLFFNGRCEEAIEFYRTAVGAEVTMMMRFKEGPESHLPTPGTEDKIMHASFRIGESTIMASDGRCQGTPIFEGFSLSISVSSEADADRLFRGAIRRRQSRDAVGQDLLVAQIRDGHRSL